MTIGVFTPINDSGWLISTAAPRYKPRFDEVVGVDKFGKFVTPRRAEVA